MPDPQKDRQRCNEKTEVYSRVVGYFRPVQQWNKGKQEEFKNRKTFDVPGVKHANESKAVGGSRVEKISDAAGEVSSPSSEGDGPQQVEARQASDCSS